MEYRIETVMEGDSTSFYIHLQEKEDTSSIGSFTQLKWAKKVKAALEWLDSADEWLDAKDKEPLSLPKTKARRSAPRKVATPTKTRRKA